MKELATIENEEIGVPMSVQEARACIEKINSHVHEVRYLLLDLYERHGWKALGYKSWRECGEKEFGQKQAFLYYQLNAARVEKNISTMVEKTNPIPERQLRPLSRLEPEKQREVWDEAVKTAPDGNVTAKHVQKIVEEKQEEWVVPKTQKIKPPSNGMQFARMAIMDLEQITRDDSEMNKAFDYVINWIKERRNSYGS